MPCSPSACSTSARVLAAAALADSSSVRVAVVSASKPLAERASCSASTCMTCLGESDGVSITSTEERRGEEAPQHHPVTGHQPHLSASACWAMPCACSSFAICSCALPGGALRLYAAPSLPANKQECLLDERAHSAHRRVCVLIMASQRVRVSMQHGVWRASQEIAGNADC